MKNINTINKTYNTAEIMNTAWSIRRKAAADMGCKVGAVIMSECLKLAWAHAEGANASINAAAIVNEWAAMSDADKVKMMSACVRKAAKHEVGYSTEDHYLQFAEVPAFGCYRPHDFDEYVSETCIRVIKKLADVDKLAALNEKRAEQGKRPIKLVSIVYNAARASIAAIFYQDSKHGAAYDIQVADDDGNTASFLETMCGGTDNTEKSAIIRTELNSLHNGLDEIGKTVLRMVMDRKTEREIAQQVGISNVAVHKRIVKIRKALEDLRTA